MSVYDVFNRKEKYVLTGYYYPFLPQTPADECYKVQYDIVDARRVSFENVIDNLPSEGARLTIRTKSDWKYKTRGYFRAQDGKFFTVEQVTINPIKQGYEQALRTFKRGVETEYILRLVEFDYDGGTV